MTMKPRPYESGSAEAEFHEAETGDTAEAFGITQVVPVVVTDPVQVQEFPPRYITTEQVPIQTVPVRVAHAHRTRVSLLMVVRGSEAVRVYIGGHSAITTTSGFEVKPEGALSIEANGEVWAVADGAGSTIHVLAQHKDG